MSNIGDLHVCMPKQNLCGTHSLLNEQHGKTLTHEHPDNTVRLSAGQMQKLHQIVGRGAAVVMQ